MTYLQSILFEQFVIDIHSGIGFISLKFSGKKTSKEGENVLKRSRASYLSRHCSSLAFECRRNFIRLIVLVFDRIADHVTHSST